MIAVGAKGGVAYLALVDQGWLARLLQRHLEEAHGVEGGVLLVLAHHEQDLLAIGGDDRRGEAFGRALGRLGDAAETLARIEHEHAVLEIVLGNLTAVVGHGRTVHLQHGQHVHDAKHQGSVGGVDAEVEPFADHEDVRRLRLAVLIRLQVLHDERFASVLAAHGGGHVAAIAKPHGPVEAGAEVLVHRIEVTGFSTFFGGAEPDGRHDLRALGGLRRELLHGSANQNQRAEVALAGVLRIEPEVTAAGGIDGLLVGAAVALRIPAEDVIRALFAVADEEESIALGIPRDVAIRLPFLPSVAFGDLAALIEDHGLRAGVLHLHRSDHLGCIRRADKIAFLADEPIEAVGEAEQQHDHDHDSLDGARLQVIGGRLELHVQLHNVHQARLLFGRFGGRLRRFRILDMVLLVLAHGRCIGIMSLDAGSVPIGFRYGRPRLTFVPRPRRGRAWRVCPRAAPNAARGCRW